MISTSLALISEFNAESHLSSPESDKYKNDDGIFYRPGQGTIKHKSTLGNDGPDKYEIKIFFRSLPEDDFTRDIAKHKVSRNVDEAKNEKRNDPYGLFFKKHALGVTYKKPAKKENGNDPYGLFFRKNARTVANKKRVT